MAFQSPRCRTCVTSASTSTATCLCRRMSSERRRVASLPSASYDRSVDWYRWPHSRCWRSLSSTNGWITGTARWHSKLPHAQIAVSSEHCGTAHLPPQALRSRHRCTRQSALAACTGANPAVLTYGVLHGDALGPFTSTADVPGRRALRSAGTKRLVVPTVRLSTVGRRAFPVAAAQIWNSLPEHIVSASTLQSFRRHLKTFLLQQSFCL